MPATRPGPTRLAYLLPARLVVGWHFVLVGWSKVSEGFPGEDLAAQLLENAPRNPVALHRAFIENVVVPNADFFAVLIAYGELSIGVSLLAGCLVRLASSFGAFHNLNILLAIAIPNAGPQVPWNAILVMVHMLFVATAVGRCAGIDGFLHWKFPRSPLF